MASSRVASRYARSLIGLAKGKSLLPQVAEDMTLVAKIASENPLFAKVMANPIIGHDKKLGILNSIFKGRVNDLSFSLFSIITTKNRETHLVSIAQAFLDQYREMQGIEVAEVTTTFPLTDSIKADFLNMISKKEHKKIELREKVDKDILGGYVLKIGDRQIDESIKSKLLKLKSKFKDNPYISKL